MTAMLVVPFHTIIMVRLPLCQSNAPLRGSGIIKAANKKLADVIYFDNKGVLRKEKSWKGWRDKKIDSQEFLNRQLLQSCI